MKIVGVTGLGGLWSLKWAWQTHTQTVSKSGAEWGMNELQVRSNFEKAREIICFRLGGIIGKVPKESGRAIGASI